MSDVLEAKPRRGELKDLGELASVCLYDNDRRIQEVLYQWQVDAETRYKGAPVDS